jgi:branched-chain amino acid transport system permease protein
MTVGPLSLLIRHPVRPLRIGPALALVAGLLVAPFVLSNYWLFVLSQLLIVTVITLGMNVIIGNAGQLALSSVAFYALGAYAYAHGFAFTQSSIAGLAIASALAALVGFGIGFVALRLRGLYLAIVTFGLIFVANDLVLHFKSVTGGAVGMSVSERSTDKGDVIASYVLVALSMLLVVGICTAMARTSFGRSLEAIKQGEDAAAAFGVKRFAHVLYAYVFSCATAGLAGGLYAVTIGYLSPEPFGFHAALLHLAIIVVGGLGTVSGPVVGGLFLGLLSELLRGYPGAQEVVFGALLLLFLLVFRGGIVGLFQQIEARFRSRKAAAPGAKSPKELGLV